MNRDFSLNIQCTSTQKRKTICFPERCAETSLKNIDNLRKFWNVAIFQYHRQWTFCIVRLIDGNCYQAVKLYTTIYIQY